MKVARKEAGCVRRWLQRRWQSNLGKDPKLLRNACEKPTIHPLGECCTACLVPLNLEEDGIKIPEDVEPPDVIVIGAGMAGLSAAHRLYHAGIKNIHVIEAEDRIGGRVYSCMLGNTTIELGGGFIEGASVANPIYNYACRAGLLKAPLKRYSYSQGQVVCYPGGIVQGSEYAEAIVNKVINEAFSVFNTSCPDYRDEPLLRYLLRSACKKTQDCSEMVQEQVSLLLSARINDLRAKWGDDLDKLSTEKFGSHIKNPGGLARPKTMLHILSSLAEDLVCEKKVHLNKPVGCVHWSMCPESSTRARVLCCDGSEFAADYCIVTVSLGVLKATAEEMFFPPLNTPKMKAIQKIGFGHLNKVFLEYEYPFWPPGQGTYHLAWNHSELSDENWIKGVCFLQEIENSNIMSVTVAGQDNVTMESCTPEFIAQELTRLLRQVLCDPGIPMPARLLHSSWSTEPFFKGAGSFMNMFTGVGDQCMLGAPLPGPDIFMPPVLLFAGEATCPGHFNTLEGARLSGIREADRIIKLTNCIPGRPQPLPVNPCISP